MFTQFRNEMHTLPFTIETSPVKAGKFYTSRREGFERGWTEREKFSERINTKWIAINLLTSSFNVNRSSQLVNWLGSISAYQTAILRSYFHSMDSVSVPLTLPCNVHLFHIVKALLVRCQTHFAASNVCSNGTRTDIWYWYSIRVLRNTISNLARVIRTLVLFIALWNNKRHINNSMYVR